MSLRRSCSSIVCVIGALGALSVARYVVIVGTATAGAWTLVVGALALMGDRTAMAAAAAGNVWVFHPLDPIPRAGGSRSLGDAARGAGVVVQLATTPRTERARPKGEGQAAA